MKRYNVKSHLGKTEYMDIISESEDGFAIRLTTICSNGEKIREDFINHSLFEICLKTGYISELAEVKMGCSAA